jgi:hypothetical protein
VRSYWPGASRRSTSRPRDWWGILSQSCGLSSRHPQAPGLWITDYRKTDSVDDAHGMAYPYTPPPIETATDPIHSAADMGQRWRALMGPLGFGERLLWIGFVGPDRCMIKALSQVPLASGATRSLVESVMSGVRDMLTDFQEGTTVALLLTRPGPGPISNMDRQWSRMLTAVADEFGVPIEPIFRANDESLVLVEPAVGAAI